MTCYCYILEISNHIHPKNLTWKPTVMEFCFRWFSCSKGWKPQVPAISFRGEYLILCIWNIPGSSKCACKNLCVFHSQTKKPPKKAGFFPHIWKIQVLYVYTPLKINKEPKMKVWKIISLFNQVIFRFHVNFPGWYSYMDSPRLAEVEGSSLLDQCIRRPGLRCQWASLLVEEIRREKTTWDFLKSYK